MSHFVVYVFSKEIGKGVDELLAPYNEGVEVAPYIKYTKEQVIENVRRETEAIRNGDYAEYLKDKEKYKKMCDSAEHIDYLENDFPKRLKWSDEECYEYEKGFWDPDNIGNHGEIYSTYNPDSKWDWYAVGGRWENSLINKDGRKTSEDCSSEIDWEKTMTPFAYITPNGLWKEKGAMGWFGMSYNEKDGEVWDLEFRKFIEELDDDVIVTVVDCHI